MKKKLVFQYYYKRNECKSTDAKDKECTCWREEGTGPYKDERHDAEVPLVDWRIKPSNVEVTGSPDLSASPRGLPG